MRSEFNIEDGMISIRDTALQNEDISKITRIQMDRFVKLVIRKKLRTRNYRTRYVPQPSGLTIVITEAEVIDESSSG